MAGTAGTVRPGSNRVSTAAGEAVGCWPGESKTGSCKNIKNMRSCGMFKLNDLFEAIYSIVLDICLVVNGLWLYFVLQTFYRWYAFWYFQSQLAHYLVVTSNVRKKIYIRILGLIVILIMPPTSKKLREHIGFGLSVRACILSSNNRAC